MTIVSDGWECASETAQRHKQNGGACAGMPPKVAAFSVNFFASFLALPYASQCAVILYVVLDRPIGN